MGMGGVQRTLKFAKYLLNYNWQPIVLTINPKKYFAVDEYLLNEAINSGIIIERTGNGELNLSKIVTRVPKEKFRKLRTYYQSAQNREGWNKYERISIEFNNQIICTKKEK